MLTTAIILFAIAAVLGAILASNFFRGKLPPLALSFAHGLFAASGLVVLILTITKMADSGMGKYSLGAFVIAALGGFYLVSRHLGKKEVPNGVIIIHALAAITGFALLLLWVYG